MRVTLENQDDIQKLRNVSMYAIFTTAAAETARLMERIGLLAENCKEYGDADGGEYLVVQLHSLGGLLATLKNAAAILAEKLTSEFGSIEAAYLYADNCKMIPVD